MAHWTVESPEAFIRRVTFDFWTQIQKRLDALPLSQKDLAQLFGVSESAVSQILNNAKNPGLRTLFNYAQAAKLKFAIVPYDDSDPERGPVNSEIFTICWNKAGRPHTFGEANKLRLAGDTALTNESLILPLRKGGYLMSGQASTENSPRMLGQFAGATFPAQAELTATTHAAKLHRRNHGRGVTDQLYVQRIG